MQNRRPSFLNARENVKAQVLCVHQALGEMGYFQNKNTDPEAKAFWKANDEFAKSYEPIFYDTALDAFDNNKREIGAILSTEKQNQKAEKRTIKYEELIRMITAYLSAGSVAVWSELFEPIMGELVGAQAERLASLLGIQLTDAFVDGVRATQWFQSYTLTFAKPINDTTINGLSTMLGQANEEGWSIRRMQNRMELMFEQWMYGNVSPEEFDWYAERLPAYRTEMIARTETIRASNWSSLELYKQWGYELKEWLATFDSRVRPAHAVAGEDYREGGRNGAIPVDEPFIVDGEALMFPGDPAGSPGNFINCRCTIRTIVK